MICNNNNIITDIHILYCTFYLVRIIQWSRHNYKMTSLKGEWIYVPYCLSDHVLTSIAPVDIINIKRLHLIKLND